MANSISHSRLPYPIRKARYTVLVPYLDADGDPTDPTTPDTEVSIDSAAFTDATEEVSTITGSDGMGYITFTGAEMDCSALGVAYKVASGPKATLMTLYPRDLVVIASGTLSAGSAGGGTISALAYDVTGCFIRTTGGTGGGGTGGANNQVRKIQTYTPSTGAFTVSPNWETTVSTDTTYDVLLPEGVTLGMLKALNPTTAGRTAAIDSSGRVDLGLWIGVAPNALSSGRVEVLLGAVASGVIAAASFASGALDAVWSTATRILTAGTNIVLAKGTGVTGFNDVSDANVQSDVQTALTAQGYTTTRAGYLDALNGIVQAIWDKATSALTTVGSIGKLLVDNINATISSRAVAGDAMALTSGERTTLAGVIEAAIINDADSHAVLQAIVDKINSVDPDLSGLTLSAIAAAVRTNLTTELARIDAAISTRLATSGYTAPDNADIAAIKAKTDLLPSDPASESSVEAAISSGATAAAAAVTSAHGSGSYVRNTEPDNSDIVVAAAAAASAASDAAAIRSVTDGLVQTAGKLWVLNESGNPISTDIIAAIDAIKGVGWTTETLKAIYDHITTPPTATEINDDWDAGVLEDGHTRADALRFSMRMVAAKTSGMEAGSLLGHLRDMADTKDSVVAVLDGNGNRTSITTADGS